MTESTRENSVTTQLTSYLQNEGISAKAFMGVDVPGEHPKEPDITINQGGTYYGEAKWESNYWQGITEARDYEQIPTANGSFTIGYPDELKQEFSQKRLGETQAESTLSGHKFRVAFFRPGEEAEMARVNLTQIPEWIDNHIHHRVEPETEPEEVVDILRQTAHRLNDELENAPDENLFRNVLGATPDENKEEKQAAKKTAGFLLVNQITFYRVLSASKHFPDINPDKLQSPSDLGDYFDIVLEYDYTPVFSFKIVDDLPQESLPVLRNAIKSIYALGPERINHDILGKIFHEIIPISARKKLAAYYTKNKTADVLANLAISDADETVMDPACGSGTLLAASYMRKRELSDLFVEQTHRTFVEEDLTGIDVMPFAAHLSCIHLALQAPIFETDEVNIAIEDSTSIEPGDTINPLSFVLPESNQQRGIHEFDGAEGPDLEAEEIEGGSIAMDAVSGEQMRMDSVDVVIMNPPYSRQESVARFGENYKNRLRDRFQRRDNKGQIHGKMSFCSYFLFLADKFLDSGGKIAAVLPASTLNKTTDSGVREMLLEEYNLQHVVARTDNPNFSEDTDMREVLVIAEKQRDAEGASTAYTKLNGLKNVSPSELLDDTNALTEGDIKSSRSRKGDYNGGEYVTRRFPAEELEEHNLFAPFTVKNHELFDLWYQIRDRDVFTRLDDVEDPWLTGGLGFGGSVPDNKDSIINHPDAALREDDVWIAEGVSDGRVEAKHRFLDEKVSVPKDVLAPDFHRFAHRSQMDVSGSTEFAVLNKEFENSERYWQMSDENGPPNRWPDVAKKRLTHLGFMRRVDLTASGLRHVAYYSDEPRAYHGMMFCLPGIKRETARRLCVWFNSSLNLLQMLISRIPSRGGWTEYHRNTVAEFYIPDPLGYSPEDKEALDQAFEEVRENEFPSMAQQLICNTSPSELTDSEKSELKRAFPDIHHKLGKGFDSRRTVDRAVLDVLSIDDRKYEQILDLLYPELLKEIVELKTMMN